LSETNLLVEAAMKPDLTSWNDLVERDGLLYKKFTDVPFTGEVTGQEQGRVKDGKEVGLWVWYQSNGQVEIKGTYKDGMKDGLWFRYYESGQLLYKETYKNGEVQSSIP
jgi:hypothetical protein